MIRPILAIVGRPNVGKSTLFNRIIRKNCAVIHDRPGITRDRLYATAEIDGKYFTVIDTGGLDLSPTDSLIANVRAQVELAIKDADAIIFVLDIIEGLTSWDLEVAEKLKKCDKPIYVAVNKVDNLERAKYLAEFYGLNLGEPRPISAIHGTGVNELLKEILDVLPPSDEQITQSNIKIAVVGRPNVGKSSLVNAVLGEERVIVDPRPGTTRDAVNITFSRNGLTFEIIDTAGMRRRKKIFDKVESLSVSKAIYSIQQSDVVWMILDATQHPAQQDKQISSYIERQGKACIFVINKWDLIEKDEKTFDRFCKELREEMALLDYIPIISVSAKEKLRIDRLLEMTQLIFSEYSMRITTHTLNKAFMSILSEFQPPMVGGKRPSPKYITQVGTNPPTFVIFTTYPELIKDPYKRYITNRLREFFGFQGAPIVLKFKSSRER